MPKLREGMMQNADEEDDDGNDGEEGPPRKITRNVGGQKRKYIYVKSVKSMTEVDKFRFKNSCIHNGNYKQRWIKSLTMPCRKKKFLKTCDFELMALRPDFKSGIIHIYARSQHNHPIMPTVERQISLKVKNLMPDENPSQIYVTPDKIEWTFLQTFSSYDKMQKFRRKNQCNSRNSNVKWWRIRFLCNRRYYKNKCKFMLLAMKTTKQGYHVYKHGQHNHNNHPVLRRKSIPI